MYSSPRFDSTMSIYDGTFDYQKSIDLRKQKRMRASARERRRKTALNSALEELRQRMPYSAEEPRKLSKIEVLLMARKYISLLSDCLANSPAQSYCGSPVTDRHEPDSPNSEHQPYPDFTFVTPDHSIPQSPDIIDDPYHFLTSQPDLVLHSTNLQHLLSSYNFSPEQMYMI